MPSYLVNDLFPHVFIASSGDVLVATRDPCVSPLSFCIYIIVLPTPKLTYSSLC